MTGTTPERKFDNLTLYPPHGTGDRIDDITDLSRSAWVSEAAMVRLRAEELADEYHVNLDQDWLEQAVNEYLDRRGVPFDE